MSQCIEKSILKDIQELLMRCAEEGIYVENIRTEWLRTIGGEKHLMDFHVEISNDKKGD